MTETLYLDLFFLVNLSADLYLLFLTGMILREPVRRRKGRLFLGAAVGAAVGGVLVFFPKLPLPVWILLELAIPAADDAGGFWPLQPFRNIAAGYRTGAYSGFKRRCICSVGSDETCLGADTLDFPGVWTCTQRSGRNALGGNGVP